MATINDTAATSALNEEEYINSLYDTNLEAQKQILGDNYDAGGVTLDSEQQQVQQNTDAYVDRTAVEARKAAGLYGTGKLSGGAQAQVALSQDNAVQRNTTALRQAQEDADTEIQRQRQLLASRYEAAIRQAQADNDMERAQALYEAAKAEEAQLRELQRQGAALLARKGDNSGYDAIAQGQLPQPDTTGQTWEQVLKNEEALNAIYDAELESLSQQLLAQHETDASELEALRRARLQQTDAELNEAYVQGLKGQKNYAEAMGAYGQGSGTAGQTRLAQDTELQDMLTALRGQQVGADAALGMQGFEAEAGYRDALAKARHDTDLERARALYEAAEAEEQNLVEDQLLVGRQRAKKNDYGLLGLLYGLTPDQVDKLQGTGRYAQRGSQGGYVDPLSAMYGISAETADAIGSLPIPGNVSPDLHPFFRQRLNQLSRSNHGTPNQGR